MHLQQSSWVTERHIMNYANHYSYSDITPFEVVKVISDKTIEVREMDAERDDSVKLEFHVGGFSAHCSNQREQKWSITSNGTNPVVRIRLGKQGWKDKHGQRFGLSDKPVKFYDYNF
jgi:hypothetical protein